MKNSRTIAMMLGLVATAGAAMANPSYTSINLSSGEVSQAGLLHAIYGGSWTANGLSYTNGIITATRVADDGLASPLDILTSNPASIDDVTWSGGSTTIVAKAKYAADSHVFGWINDVPGPSFGGGTFQPIFSTTSFNTPVTVALSSSFRWAINDTSTSKMYTSNASDNVQGSSGATDQMATYAITGSGVAPHTWLLAWEDRITGSDRDFNDAAIEITAVPAPSVFALAGLGGVVTLNRRRRA